MSKEADERFKQLFEDAKKDENIIGFFLGGSRAKGLENEFSDYDVYIIVKDSKLKEYKRKYPFEKYKNMDLIVYSISEFKKHASWDGPENWARYSFAHLKVMINKNKKIQKSVDEKSRIPKNKIRPFISAALDGYINYVYRSLKCAKNGDLLAARLEAALSIPLLLDAIFALHGGRLRPYYKYLEWEFMNFPLNKFHMNSKEILKSVSNILDNADIKTQQKLLETVEKLFRKEGYDKVFDNWGDKLDWMKKFQK